MRRAIFSVWVPASIASSRLSAVPAAPLRLMPQRSRGPVGSSVQGGVGFDLQQQLGANSPLGWFGRFGHANSQVSAGGKNQIGTGFVMLAPLHYAGWVPELSNDLMGVGFVWSQPSTTSKIVYHENEYVFDTFYTLQLSPLSRVQPDLQIVWNPAFNPDPGPAVVFQIQFLLRW